MRRYYRTTKNKMAEKTVAQLKEEIDILGAEVEKNKTIIEDQEVIIAELTQQLKDKEVEAKVKAVVLTHNKKKYKVLGNVKVGVDVFTAEDLAKKENADLVASLIEKGSGMFVELEKE